MALSRNFGRLSALLTSALALAGAASAGGTTAGTNVANTFTLDYTVGGNSQPQINNTASPTNFTVDRKIDLTITPLDPTQSVAPNSVDNNIRYRLTNLGNDNQAYNLSVAIPTPTYTPANVSISYFIDLDNDGVLDGGETLVSYTPGTATVDIAPDQNVVVIVQSDVPSGAADGTSANFVLSADTLFPVTSVDAACTPVLCPAGTAVGADAGGNTLTGAAENVLADGAGSTDAVNQGDYSASAVLNVVAPTLAASKSVTVMSTSPASDAACSALTTPVAGAQYTSPGACVQYVIAVNNTGAGTASALDISDRLPAQLRFISATRTGFADDTGIAGTGPTLAQPGAAENCDGSTNCLVRLTDAILAGSSSGQITIWARVR